MRNIHKVMTTVDYAPEDMKKLRDLFPGSEFVALNIRDTPGVMEALKDADVAILGGDIDMRFLGENHLKWIHCDHAGLARSARPELLERGVLLSGSAGRSSPVLAEHCIYFMLQACYHTKELLAAQQAHHWGVPGQDTWRGLYGRTAGIIGFGNNGRQLAERLHAFGMHLMIYDRVPVTGYEYIDCKLCSAKGDRLETLLENSDFVVLCIALTNETAHMIDRNAIAAMKPGCVLVNMSRGELVDTDALLEGLDGGKIACAGLDVFDPEPLPADSPLWDRPEVYITPHVTPQVPNRTARSLDIIAENVRRYRAEEPLLNQVTATDVWTKGKGPFGKEA